MSFTAKRSDHIIINAPAQRVWEINGLGFTEIGLWSRGVQQSRPISGPPPSGAPARGRVCEVAGFGEIHETIHRFDAANRSITLTVDAGLPFFVKRSEFTSRVSVLSETQCRFEVSQTMEVSIFPGGLLLPILRRKIAKTVQTILDDLRIYAESGEPHPDKVDARAA